MDLQFLDHRSVEHTYFLDRHVTPIRRPLDGPAIENCHSPQTVLRETDGTYRMWYVSRRKIAGHSGSGRQYTLHHAVSQDGLGWSCPSLGLKEVDGSRDNNVVMTRDDILSHNESGDDSTGPWNFCVIDSKTSEAPHTRGRFTALVGDRNFAFSDDGLHWTFYPENPVFDPGGSDTYNNFHFDPRIKRYVLYHRPHPRIRACGWRQANRLIARIESDDLIHWDWSSARCVLDTDHRDAPAVSNAKQRRGRDVQFYALTVAMHAGIYIGFAQTLNEITGYMDQRLVQSADGIHWWREPHDVPIISPNPNAWDSGMVGFVPHGCPLSVGDDLMIYYGGTNMNHNYQIMDGAESVRMGLGVGVIQRGRLIGYHAGSEKGELLTRPFLLVGQKLSLNVAASGGEAVAGIVQDDGTPIEGLSQEEAEPICKDGLAVPLRWRGGSDLSEWLGRPVRLRIAVTDATIYGLQAQ